MNDLSCGPATADLRSAQADYDAGRYIGALHIARSISTTRRPTASDRAVAMLQLTERRRPLFALQCVALMAHLL